MRKIPIHVNVEGNLRERALNLGINFSQVLEEALENKLFLFNEKSEIELENKIKQKELELKLLKTKFDDDYKSMNTDLNLLKQQLAIVKKEKEKFDDNEFKKLCEEFKELIRKHLESDSKFILHSDKKKVWIGIFANRTKKQVNFEFLDELIEEVRSS